jgi:hypothetical protein
VGLKLNNIYVFFLLQVSVLEVTEEAKINTKYINMQGTEECKYKDDYSFSFGRPCTSNFSGLYCMQYKHRSLMCMRYKNIKIIAKSMHVSQLQCFGTRILVTEIVAPSLTVTTLMRSENMHLVVFILRF